MVSFAHRIEAEADPEDWWYALLGLLARLDLEGVSGIGLSGIGRSQVLTDADGAPLRPAMCFHFTRAAAEAEEMAGVAAGSWTEMSAWHPLARLEWIRRHEPEVFARTRLVLQPKDWLAMRLTGRAATDRIGCAWALDRKGRSRDLSLFRRAGLDPALLPDVIDPWQVVGRVCAVPELSGVPVFSGALDTWCTTLGAGVGEGDGYIASGSTDAAGMLSNAPLWLEGRVTLPWGQGLFHTGGPSGAGGVCLDWLAELLSVPNAAAVTALAEQAVIEPGRPLFLPEMAGARAPLWWPAARGAFFGLETRHGAAAMALAVLEGVAMADAAVLDGLAPARVMLCGGGARSDFWCRLRAAVLGRDVLRPVAAEPGVVGAALLALVGLGSLSDLDAARSLAEQGAERFVAEPELIADYCQRREVFAAAQAAALPVSTALRAQRTET